ncbi:hypothetical protein T484DRAFT_1794450 [Baffinella frigidus]|nr:hypothetical protein T484DRAFT_1794450 [Cryptophyta sp. CCMP2293]
MVFKMSVAHCLAALNVLIAIPGILLVGMGAYLVYLAPALEEPDGAAILSQLAWVVIVCGKVARPGRSASHC